MQVLPYLRLFEQLKSVNVDADGFFAYPKCYRTLDADENECILLEDLENRGFTMLDNSTKEMTVEHVRLYLRALAKFHAISFAINDQQPEKFKQLTSNSTDIFLCKGNATAAAFYAAQHENYLKTFSAPEDAHIYRKLKELFAKGASNVGLDNIEQQLSESATVISHGDAYQNNTLFKYDTSENPVEICFIDWQLSRHLSPVIDFIYFVFFCNTKEMRDIHYEHFLETYHSHLSAHIRR